MKLQLKIKLDTPNRLFKKFQKIFWSYLTTSENDSCSFDWIFDYSLNADMIQDSLDPNKNVQIKWSFFYITFTFLFRYTQLFS